MGWRSLGSQYGNTDQGLDIAQPKAEKLQDICITTQQEQHAIVEAAVTNIAEVILDEQVAQAVFMADEDSTTVWKPGGLREQNSLLMLRKYEEDLLESQDIIPVLAEGLKKP